MPEEKKQRVGIVAECVSDLPKSFFREHGIDVLYFLIETDSGVFTDTDEITSENVIGYMESGGVKSLSSPPPPDVYVSVFEKNLERFDDVILVAISDKISASCAYARKAAEKMGERGKHIHIFDSMHLSTGLGHIVIKAAELAEEGLGADEIISRLTEFRGRVCTSFITVNADYLNRSGRVGVNVKKICDTLNVHPILYLKDGRITLKSVLFGNYENAYIRYVRRMLKYSSDIDKKRVFITHIGCSLKMVERIKQEVGRCANVEELIVTNASATISSSCGPRTFGVLFVRNGASGR